MRGEFDLKFCNRGEFCMRVRERERESKRECCWVFGGGNGERPTIMYS